MSMPMIDARVIYFGQNMNKLAMLVGRKSQAKRFAEFGHFKKLIFGNQILSLTFSYWVGARDARYLFSFPS